MMVPLLLALAAFHIPVSCAPQLPGDRPDAEGAYLPAEQMIVLSAKTCAALAAARNGVASYWTARGLSTLGHELAHSYGIRNETGADCVGGMLLGFAGEKIGVPARVIRLDWGYDQTRDDACRAWDAVGDPH